MGGGGVIDSTLQSLATIPCTTASNSTSSPMTSPMQSSFSDETFVDVNPDSMMTRPPIESSISIEPQ